MATKLKKMKLTSVDLVRAGANQEADICLYKSADSQEAAGGPTEDEMNIFKRFIAFIRGTPTEAKNEPHSNVVKAQEPEGPADLESIYKSALVDSIHSIYTDGSLTEVEKKAMTELSIGQFQEKMREVPRDSGDSDDEPEDQDYEDDPDDEDRYDDIEEIEAPVHKFNQNHDADGKFTSAGGGGGGGAVPSAGGGVAEHVKMLNSLPTKSGMSKVTYEDAKAYQAVLNKIPKGTKLTQKIDAGIDTFERTSDSEIGISWKHTRAPWGKVDNETSFDVGRWLAGNAVIARGPIELMQSSPNDSSVRKYNHNHGTDGKFTSSGGGGATGAAPSPGGEVKERVKELNNLPKKNGTSHVGYEEIAAYEKVLNKMPKGTKLSQRIDSGTDTFERINDSKIGPSWKHTRSPWGTVEHKSSFDVGRSLAGSGYIARGQIEIAN